MVFEPDAGITAVYSTAESIDYRESGLPPGTESGAPATKSGFYNLMIEGSHLLRARIAF